MPKIEDTSYEFLNRECLGDSCIIIPFVIGREEDAREDMLCGLSGVKGVLNMGNIKNMESEDIIEYSASLVRNIIGINILNASLYQNTQRLASFDSMTGLYNKHIFLEFLNRKCNSSERYGTSFFLVFLDIDDFKAINDNYGHCTGDEVLGQLGTIIQNSIRKSDIAARFGGEEYAWIIQGESQEKIASVLEKIRNDIYTKEFPKKIQLSVSIGLSRYHPQNGDSRKKIIDRADTAMYQAKSKGKNRVEVFTEKVVE